MKSSSSNDWSESWHIHWLRWSAHPAVCFEMNTWNSKPTSHFDLMNWYDTMLRMKKRRPSRSLSWISHPSRWILPVENISRRRRTADDINRNTCKSFETLLIRNSLSLFWFITSPTEFLHNRYLKINMVVIWPPVNTSAI